MPKKKRLLQVQRPMAAVLTACTLPALMGVYTFGWRVLAVVAVCNLCCFLGEYAFVRRVGRPVSMAALVTGTLLALILPPNIPFWMAALGSPFAIVFGKMVFGGFGKNIFNPAMVGRCFLYVTFPLFLTSSWYGPIDGPAAGLLRWTAGAESEPVREVAVPPSLEVEGVTGATPLAAIKRLNAAGVEARRDGRSAELRLVRDASRSLSLWRLLSGRMSGSQGETCALAILAAFAYLLYRKAVIWQLAVSPVLGMVAGWFVLRACGADVLPLGVVVTTNLFAGGGLFAFVFMTTEPVSAPTNKLARWLYGGLIGFLGAIIRSLSIFNAGLMFAILLANMFGPLIEIGCTSFESWRKARSGQG